MASDNHRRIESGLSSRLIFRDEAIHFSRSGGGDHTAPKKPAGDGGGFDIDGRSQYGSHNRGWIFGGRSRSEASYGEDEDDYDVDDDDDLDEGDGLVSLDDNNNNVKNGNNSSSSEHSSLEKENGEKGHSPFGLRRGMMVRDINLSEHQQQQQQQQEQEPVGNYENAISVVHPESYCSQSMNGGDGSSSVQRETRGENGCVFGGRKEAAVHMDPGESLRSHFVDPLTGELMDDAMILPCGHSFGSGGMQHVSRMKACCKCSRPISEDDRVRPNLALRSAVQAFRREEEQTSKVAKRRRDRFEQDKCSPNDPYPMDSRGKGVQFPFMVSDRVIIKGNKRTPERFVGRIAVVTTQCLNGWYVVKTLDNAESVKLQYRSLAKVADDSSPSSMIQNKSTTPSWL